MEFITTGEVRKMLQKDSDSFSISFQPCNLKNPAAKPIRRIVRAKKCGLPKRVGSYANDMFGVLDLDHPNSHPIAVHMRLVTRFNGLKVIP